MAENAGTPFDSGGKKKARIEIIPLIDVIFFLLATFVLFTLSLNKIQSMETNLPVAAPPTKNAPPEEPLIIQVSEGDSVFWSREPVSMNEVYPRLVQYRQSAQNPRVLISGDDRAKYGSLIRVLDYVRAAGIEQVSFETEYRPSGR